MRNAIRCLCAMGVSLLTCAAVQAGEMTEAQKRVEFAKAVVTAKPEDRVAAVQILKGAKENASLLFLSKVAANDVDANVRLAAFNLIAEWDDPVGKLESVVLELFREEKHRANKISMVQVFPRLKVKTAAIDETLRLLYLLVNPGTYNNNNNHNNNNNQNDDGLIIRPRSKEEIEEMRRDYKNVLSVLNTLTRQSFSASGEKGKDQAKKWWVMNKNDVLKADAEMLVKLRDEAQAAAAKKN